MSDGLMKGSNYGRQLNEEIELSLITFLSRDRTKLFSKLLFVQSPSGWHSLALCWFSSDRILRPLWAEIYFIVM